MVYDIESLPNIFTFRGKILGDDSGSFRFEISDRVNDISKLRRLFGYMVKQGIEMIGFNNLMYDYPVLHALMHLSDEYVNAQNINTISNDIIGDNSMGGFGVVIWSNQQLVPQWDIYLIHHFNNSARRTSLKAIEFWQRSLNVKEFEASFTDNLAINKFDDLHEYNEIDVLETEKFVEYSMDMLDLREDLMQTTSRDFRYANNGKIGESIFIDMLGVDNCFTYDNGERVPVGTPRKSVKLMDTVSVKVKLDDVPEFTAIKDFFLEQTVIRTKGAFNPKTLDFSPQMLKYIHREVTATDLLKREALRLYEAGTPLKSNLYPARTFAFIKRHDAGTPIPSDNTDGKIENVNVVQDGLQYVFGTGGLHASRHKAVYYETDTDTILDWDFTAYYPSLGKVLNICPKQFKHLKVKDSPMFKTILEIVARNLPHLSDEELLEVSLWEAIQIVIWDRRQSFEKGTAGYMAYKEAGNIPYGKSGFDKSCFYDPKYMLSICVNGQLLTMTLVEMLITRTDATMIQANTDGITFKVPRHQVDLCHSVQKEFEEHTGLAIEEAVYKSMHIRDVNNYIATYTDGKIKAKGAYEVDKLPHKDSSMTVVSKAVLANIRDGVEIEDFIYGHKDMFDFFKRVKLNKGGKCFIDGKMLHEKVVRYYVSVQGKELTKKTEKSTTRVEAGYKCQIAQDVTGMSFPNDINYEYYVKEAYKLLRFAEEEEDG